MALDLGGKVHFLSTFWMSRPHIVVDVFLCITLVTCVYVCVLGLDSMLTLWRTCWTSGGSFERGSSENPAFSTEETTSKTSAGSDGSSATSSLSTIHLLLTFSTQKML